MLDYGPEVLDADDDMEVFLLDLVAFKLVPLDGDGGMKRLLEHLLGRND